MSSQFDPTQPYADAYEELFDHSTDELERLHNLQGEVRQGTDLLNEIGPDTVFGRYIRARKTLAAQALINLTQCDCRNAAEIACQQQTVREYIDLIQFINTTTKAAAMARETIALEFGNDDTSDAVGGTDDHG